MADLRISQLPALPGVLLQASDQLAVVDISASETKNIESKDLVQAAIQLIDAGSIPSDKVTFALPAGSVVSATLADGSVTAVKLANSSTAVIGASLPATGDYTGQLGITTATNAASVWDGGKWAALETGYTTITGGSVNDVSTVVTTVGDSAQVVAQIDDSSIAASFLAGPTASPGAVTLRTIVPADLPEAGIGSAGIVSIPSGGGLRIDGPTGSALVIDNDIVDSVDPLLVTYDTKGLVKSGRAIQSSDLPLATSGTPGVISAGPEFTVTPAGLLNIANSVSGSTHTKISYDSNGLITSGTNLVAADIPDLDASKITTGSFGTTFITDKAITKSKLANNSISYIQEAVPSISDTINHTGMLWFQESTAGLHMWNSNSWMPISIGRLSQENLRYCGIVDATTGLVRGVTPFGTSAGYIIGDPLAGATNERTGVYFVISNAGSGIPETPGINYDEGDWILCNGTAAGWVRIDTLSGGGGGGGGATRLGELLDVTLISEVESELLQLQSTGQWTNTSLISGGTY